MFIFHRKKKFKTQPPKENNPIDKTNNFLEATERFLKTTAGAITSVTLLLGATTSLGVAVGAQIPKTCANRHFTDTPKQTIPHTIHTADASVNMKINVYENGDILTEYGTKTEWLCFPEVKIVRIASSLTDFLIPQAVAQTTVPNVRAKTTYIQEQALSPNDSRIIEQTRIYSDGTVEKMWINRRTGTIIDKKVSTTTITPELRERLNRGAEIEETIIIDVR